MAYFTLPLALMLAAAGSDREPPHNCFLRLTNDHVRGTYMYYDYARSAEECRAKAAAFARESNFSSMRDEVRVLFYEVEYRKTIIARIDLKS